MKSALWGIFFVAIAVDIYKSFNRKKAEELMNENEQYNKNFNNNNITHDLENIDLNLEENLELKTKSDNNKEPRTTKIHDDDVDKVIITISYCGTSNFVKQIDVLKKEFLGNYTNVEVYGQEHPVPTLQKYLAKSVSFIQFGLIILSVGGQTVRQYVSFLPQSFFNFLDEKKWMIGIFSYMVGGQISSVLTTTGAFEVFVNDNIQVWSRYEKKAIPHMSELVGEIERLGLTLQ